MMRVQKEEEKMKDVKQMRRWKEDGEDGRRGEDERKKKMFITGCSDHCHSQDASYAFVGQTVQAHNEMERKKKERNII